MFCGLNFGRLGGKKKGWIGEFLRGNFGDKFELAWGGFYGTLESA